MRTSTMARHALVAGVIVLLATSIAIGLRAYARAPLLSGTQARTEAEEDAGAIEWCAEGLVAISGGGCFAGPVGGPPDAPLIVYLHGIYDEHAVAEELDRQHRVATRGTARGFAVLALRGTLGGCSTEPDLATKFCWPSNERTAARGPGTVEEWTPSLRAAARLGASGPRYMLGFSNGGFFAGLLAARGWFDATAFAIASGGPVEPVHALGAKPPLLLMSADDDPAQEGMMRFDDELTREGWPHENYFSAGAHQLTDHEIDAALTFFVRLRREKLPLDPPLSRNRPRVRETPRSADVVDADAPESLSGEAADTAQDAEEE
jgi:predicted esterase